MPDRPLQPGEMVPPFELEDRNGTVVRRDDYVGSTHLLIYLMRAFSCLASRGNVRYLARSRRVRRSGCELLAVAPGPRDEAERFAKTVTGNAVIIADPHERFHQEFGFPRVFLGLVQSSGPLVMNRLGRVHYVRCSANPGHAVDMDELFDALLELEEETP